MIERLPLGVGMLLGKRGWGCRILAPTCPFGTERFCEVRTYQMQKQVLSVGGDPMMGPTLACPFSPRALVQLLLYFRGAGQSWDMDGFLCAIMLWEHGVLNVLFVQEQ